MGALLEIDPYNLYTLQEIDDAIAFVSEECADIEGQIENPDEEQTIGWLRRAKSSLGLAKSLKQRLQNRRADVASELRTQRASRVERMFMNVCKEIMSKEEFLTLVAKAEGKLQSSDTRE